MHCSVRSMWSTREKELVATRVPDIHPELWLWIPKREVVSIPCAANVSSSWIPGDNFLERLTTQSSTQQFRPHFSFGYRKVCSLLGICCLWSSTKVDRCASLEGYSWIHQVSRTYVCAKLGLIASGSILLSISGGSVMVQSTMFSQCWRWLPTPSRVGCCPHPPPPVFWRCRVLHKPPSPWSSRWLLQSKWWQGCQQL